MGASTLSGAEVDGGHRGFIVAALVCGFFGVAGWVFDLWFFHGAPVQDWMVFYTTARAYFDGNLPLIFDGQTLTAAINERFIAWLVLPLGPHPWVYPPPFLLMLLPFGLVPPLVSVVLFMATGFAAAVLVVWRYVDSGVHRWPIIGTLLFCPAVPFNVLTGQNAFYTAALLIAAFCSVAGRPFLGGALLGLLSVKPQLCLAALVALVAMRQWRALAGVGVSACLLAVASALVLGLDIWRTWLGLAFGGNELYRAWLEVGRLNGISVYACVSWLGAPGSLASLAQVAATLAAGGFVYWLYRQPVSTAMRLAGLLAATVLAAPHVSNSDAVLLGLAAVFFIAAIPAGGLRPYQLTIAATLWISPLLNPPVLFRVGCATPLLVTMLLAAIAVAVREQRARGAAAVTAQSLTAASV